MVINSINKIKNKLWKSYNTTIFIFTEKDMLKTKIIDFI